VTKLRGRKLHLKLLGTGLILVVFWAITSTYLYVSKRSASNLALQSKLTGTWVAESGIVLKFLSDGSGSTRSSDSKTTNDSFEWNASRNELRLFTGLRKSDLQTMIRRHLLGAASFRFEIVELSSERIQLRDKSTGLLNVLNKTAEQLLDAAPSIP
jgi:hypothetical protein